ncbi:MAG: ATP-binding protein [Bacteroidia bacterium]|jgi:hypothetical protein|nr:ATP-binding protein [Bacteroidales bacterium]NCD41400.1 ATP-binding protein [Bacteroidia bacterium]MDD2323745.1 ATP-binding protein [Bacteroidales bacterium]MDD3010411.1 ATP-binding protein [Bacteroidales bacterium]MDD3962109.1 ATP-binding protein [Bacteroidales bacterium]
MKEICENIIDIVNNSIRAEANFIRIDIQENEARDLLTLAITDNGKGMDRVTLDTIADPFYTTKKGKKTGMGTSLLKYHAELTGGHFFISSESGIGTQVIAEFGLTHLDRQPLGDMTGTLLLLITSHPEVHFRYKHTTSEGTYLLDTEEIRDALGGIALNQREIRNILKELITSNLESIGITP